MRSVEPEEDAADAAGAAAGAAGAGGGAAGLAAAGVGAGAGAALAGAGADADAAAEPAPSITATMVWMGTVWPSAILISFRTPAEGEGISASTLSVEISKRGSSRSTLSPGFLSHLVMVPSKMLSPIWGITMSTAMCVLLEDLVDSLQFKVDSKSKRRFATEPPRHRERRANGKV